MDAGPQWFLCQKTHDPDTFSDDEPPQLLAGALRDFIN
jgi:hypothetical protein